MGTGNITLYWYLLCCFFTFFVLACTAGILATARFQRWRKARRDAQGKGKSRNEMSPPDS